MTPYLLNKKHFDLENNQVTDFYFFNNIYSKTYIVNMFFDNDLIFVIN